MFAKYMGCGDYQDPQNRILIRGVISQQVPKKIDKKVESSAKAYFPDLIKMPI